MEWEYKVVTARNTPQYPGWDIPQAGEHLNELGREGWELVAVWGYPFVLFLKRPVAPEWQLEQTEAEQFAQVVLGMG